MLDVTTCANRCQLDGNFACSSVIQLPKTEKLCAFVHVNICKQPVEVYVRIKAGERFWQNSFLASNVHESRVLGDYYWPLRLEMEFTAPGLATAGTQMNSAAPIRRSSALTSRGNKSPNGSDGFSIRALLEAVKISESMYFLNDSISSASLKSLACHSAKGLTVKSSLIPLTVVSSTLLLLLFALLMAVVFARSGRRIKRMRRQTEPTKQITESSSASLIQSLLPSNAASKCSGKTHKIATKTTVDCDCAAANDLASKSTAFCLISEKSVCYRCSDAQRKPKHATITEHLPIPPNQAQYYRVISSKCFSPGKTTTAIVTLPLDPNDARQYSKSATTTTASPVRQDEIKDQSSTAAVAQCQRLNDMPNVESEVFSE